MSDALNAATYDVWDGLLECGLLEWPLNLRYARTGAIDAAPDGGPVSQLHFQPLAFDELDEGAVFALCWYPELAGPPPVIWFGSEDRIVLVAADEAAFLRQLAAGETWCDARWVQLDPDPEQGFADWDAVHEIITDGLGRGALSPTSATSAAAVSHPALAAWIAAITRQRRSA